ncbi:hypothetical protein CUJ89_19430 [Burkholderia pyrrocinia]|uniref:ATP-dependent serine protease n=1 Tax=Burkholderia pyrrocinia TaxID=60550 RepID=A0A2Z5MZG3_BURPY|nr:hypothetical protein [Burkholderia pyrrocinia]AXF22691.1 hypothetical protein CUJ89_19430 [Burkholderia pyrrocinia]
MRILLNRKIVARDTLTGVLNAHARSRHTACCRCTQCGFVAFRALEHCPACGRWNWPFEPIRRAPDDTRATHTVQSFFTWSSRVARTLRNAAFRRPRASSAPIMSILTLVLLVGGYVTVDRTCKADPVCRGSNTSGAAAIESVVHASNDPVLPVLPAPVYPFHSTDGTQLAANQQHGGPSAIEPASPMPVARAAPSMRARDRLHSGAVRQVDWRGSRAPAHRTHAIRRVSLHTGHVRRTAPSHAEVAKLYRGR